MFDWDEYFNTPEQVAKRKADMVAFYAARDAEDKRIKEELEAHRAILRAAAAELKADNDAAELKEYKRLFAADKARYLAAYNDDALAHSLACADAQYRENQKLGYSNEQENEMQIIINEKEVDLGSIVIDGIDPRDYPDFADAYVEYAESVNGYGLTEAECELLQDKYSDIIYDLIIDQLCCAQENEMLDDLLILCIAGMATCVIFMLAIVVAKIRGWE